MRTTAGRIAAAVLILNTLATKAGAKDLFDLNLSVTTPTVAQAQAAYDSITNLANSLTNSSLSALSPSYTSTSAATSVLNIRGLTASAIYGAGSPALVFLVPSQGINLTFNGATRDQSQQLFKNFLLKDGGSILSRLLQGLVAHTPIDPIAGNPNSLQNSMAAADFSIATGIGLGGTEIPGGGRTGGLLGQPNLVTAGGDIGIASAGGYTTSIVSLPLRYTIPFADPRYALTLDSSITWLKTGTASSYLGGIGASLRIPVTDDWFLSPSLRFGAAGSVDLGAAALEYAGGLASRYDLYFGDLNVTIGNAVSIMKTGGVSIGSVNVNYDLTNEVFTNGGQVEGSLPGTMFGKPTSWQAYLADTYVAGSKVYINHYDEIGFTVGTRHGLNTQDWDAFRVGAGVTFGANYNAFKAGFTYRF